MKYSIDTSSILNGWVRYYPPDVFPNLWDRIDELIRDGKLKATEEVFFELEKKADEVYKWAKTKAGLFVPIDNNIQIAVAGILAKYERLVDARKNRSSADPFVIALAQMNGCKVVTAEQPTNNLNKPRRMSVLLSIFLILIYSSLFGMRGGHFNPDLFSQ